MSLEVFAAFFEIMTLSLMFILSLILFYNRIELQKQMKKLMEDLDL